MRLINPPTETVHNLLQYLYAYAATTDLFATFSCSPNEIPMTARDPANRDHCFRRDEVLFFKTTTTNVQTLAMALAHSQMTADSWSHGIYSALTSPTVHVASCVGSHFV